MIASLEAGGLGQKVRPGRQSRFETRAPKARGDEIAFLRSADLLQRTGQDAGSLRRERIGGVPVTHPAHGFLVARLLVERDALKHRQAQAKRLLALARQPALIAVAIGQVEAFQKRLGESVSHFVQAGEWNLVETCIYEAARFPEIDRIVVDLERYPLPVRQEAGAVLTIDHAANLAQRPAQRPTRVVRQVPEQFAEAFAPVRAAGEREIGEKRARLARGRKGMGERAAGDPQLAEDGDAEWG